MIVSFKKFKLFESADSSKYELVNEFLDNDYISNYYDEHYLTNYNESDIIDIITNDPNIISGVFDSDKYVEDTIKNEINNSSMDDFDDQEFKDYIENHLTIEMENKIIEYYCENNDSEKIIKTEYDGIVSIIENDDIRKIVITEGDSTEEYEIPNNFFILVEDGDEISYDTIIAKSNDVEYDSDMIDDLDSDQLKYVIQEYTDEVDFFDEMIRDRYEGRYFTELLVEIYCVDNLSELIKDMTPKKFYQNFSSYIDDDKLVKNYKKFENDDTKSDWIKYQIANSIEIQHYLMDNFNDSDNLTLLLFEIFEDKDEHNDDISDEYEFQKRYIKEYVKENGYDDSTEEEKGDLIADALKKLNSNFILDSEIKKEFKQYMFIVDTNKFNM